MPDAYCQLLDATIHHLETLKSRGVHSVVVSAETLAALRQSPRAPARRNPLAPTGAGSATQPRAGLSSTAAPAVGPIAEAKLVDPAPTNAKATPVSAGTVLTSEAKAAAFAELRQRVLACVKCSHL